MSLCALYMFHMWENLFGLVEGSCTFYSKGTCTLGIGISSQRHYRPPITQLQFLFFLSTFHSTTSNHMWITLMNAALLPSLLIPRDTVRLPNHPTWILPTRLVMHHVKRLADKTYRRYSQGYCYLTILFISLLLWRGQVTMMATSYLSDLIHPKTGIDCFSS